MRKEDYPTPIRGHRGKRKTVRDLTNTQLLAERNNCVFDLKEITEGEFPANILEYFQALNAEVKYREEQNGGKPLYK